ncbi:hypothetical protein SHKM778_19610 [Streptomyces sp. KM77-8]|uniref:Uncharacterized protein n=1 Tax=Streptomyces haneummycinicus TaxID=3074435 RepID=A0AAT9HDV3_9ACTN
MEGLGEVAPYPALGVEQTEPAGDVDAFLEERGGLLGAADAFEDGRQVHIGASHHHVHAQFGRPVLDLVHPGKPGFDVAGVDDEAAEGEPGVEFDVVSADHAGVLDGAFGGGHGVRAGFVQHGPAGGGGEDLGVHLGRGSPRTRSCAVPSSAQPSPRARDWVIRERCTQNQAARRGPGPPRGGAAPVW